MRPRSLWPREHGTYFQLAIPLAATAVGTTPSLAVYALIAASCLLFLANEPLRVWLGLRGPRLRSEAGPRARRRFDLLVAAGVACGLVGLVLAPVATWLAVFLVAALVAGAACCAWRGSVHTLFGELVAAAALTSACVPVLVAGGTGLGHAVVIWFGWAIGFGASVVAVHRVIDRHRRPVSLVDHATVLGLIATAAACLTYEPLALPLVAVSAALVIAPPRVVFLRAVGIGIAVTGLGSAALAIAGAA